MANKEIIDIIDAFKNMHEIVLEGTLIINKLSKIKDIVTLCNDATDLEEIKIKITDIAKELEDVDSMHTIYEKINKSLDILSTIQYNITPENVDKFVDETSEFMEVVNIDKNSKIKNLFVKIINKFKKYQKELDIYVNLYKEFDKLWDTSISKTLGECVSLMGNDKTKEHYKNYINVLTEYGNLLEKLCDNYSDFERIVNIIEKKIVENAAEIKANEIKLNKTN